MLIKEGQYHHNVRVGRRTRSTALVAAAWDHRADALSALAVLAGLVIVQAGGPGWVAADEVAALVVVLLILSSGVGLLRTSVAELMDAQVDAAFLDALRTAAAEVEAVRCVEKLRMRKTGLEFLGDIHVQVDPELTVAEGHRIGHEGKALILRRFPAVHDLVVHLEPAPPDACAACYPRDDRSRSGQVDR